MLAIVPTSDRIDTIMALSFTRSFQTPIFEIRAGDTHEVFHAHAGILAQSKVLQKLVAGWASETEERKIIWKEWDADTVEKFLEWLYTGDYTCSYPKKVRKVARKRIPDADVVWRKVKATEQEPSVNNDLGERPPDEDFPVELQEEEWGREVPNEVETPPVLSVEQPALDSELESSDGVCSSPRKDPLTPLRDLKWHKSHHLQPESQDQMFNAWIEKHLGNPESDRLDYEATFMTHAKLYVMACQMDLHELKNMSWQRLRSLLVALGSPTPGQPVIGNMVTLIHYTYKETGMSELAVDPLRDLLTSFVAIHFTKFYGPDVDALFASGDEDDREFVVDVLAKVKQNVAYLQKRELDHPTSWH